MIDRSFIDKIQELSEIKTFEIGGKTFSHVPLSLVLPPAPLPLSVSNLTALSDYFKSNVDKHVEFPIVHVVGPQKVNAISALIDQSQRYIFLAAIPILPGFEFARYSPVEEFIISIQANFVPDDATASLLRIVGNLTDGRTTNFNDDGVTQQVTAKTGVARVENVPVPNPVLLAPYRTFHEVEQPKSRFIFRIKSVNETPHCALFEADGGAWQNVAILSIRDWLKGQLPESVIILA